MSKFFAHDTYYQYSTHIPIFFFDLRLPLQSSGYDAAWECRGDQQQSSALLGAGTRLEPARSDPLYTFVQLLFEVGPGRMWVELHDLQLEIDSRSNLDWYLKT